MKIERVVKILDLLLTPEGKHLVSKCYPLSKPIREWRKTPNEQPPVPFPTLYWLACPHLSSLISRLEFDGWIQKIEQEVKIDKEKVDLLREQSVEYAKQRWDLLLVITMTFK